MRGMELRDELERLREHLIAHRQTLDPWVLVYDSRGTFGSRIGSIITLDPERGKGSLFGVPVRRSSMSCEEGGCSSSSCAWVSRSDLDLLVGRIMRTFE